jgi:hypothetical protein
MGEIADSVGKPDGEGEIGRRRFLASAAAAGGLAFAVPAIVTMKPAGASTLTSPPPKPPDPPAERGTVTVKPESAPDVGGETAAAPGGAGGGQPALAPVVAAGQLPFTGASVKEMLAAGLAATGAGTAMVVWSSERAQGDPPEAAAPPTTS